jgi:Virulence factor BrkB
MRKEPPEIMTSASSIAARSFWKLGGPASWRLGRTVFEQIIVNNVFGRAAELTFYFLFALFPLIFFMMTLFGLFASRSVELQNNFLSYFADFLQPTPGKWVRDSRATWLAYNRRVDIVLMPANSESVRLYPNQAPDPKFFGRFPNRPAARLKDTTKRSREVH